MSPRAKKQRASVIDPLQVVIVPRMCGHWCFYDKRDQPSVEVWEDPGVTLESSADCVCCRCFHVTKDDSAETPNDNDCLSHGPRK